MGAVERGSVGAHSSSSCGFCYEFLRWVGLLKLDIRIIKVLAAFFVYLFMCSISSSRGDDRFSAQNHVIAALRNFASTKNVHVTLVIHPRKVCVSVHSSQETANSLLSLCFVKQSTLNS